MLLAETLREYASKSLQSTREEIIEMLIAEAKQGAYSCIKVLNTLDPSIITWLAEQGVSTTVTPWNDSPRRNPTMWTYDFKWDT